MPPVAASKRQRPTPAASNSSSASPAASSSAAILVCCAVISSMTVTRCSGSPLSGLHCSEVFTFTQITLPSLRRKRFSSEYIAISPAKSWSSRARLSARSSSSVSDWNVSAESSSAV